MCRSPSARRCTRIDRASSFVVHGTASRISIRGSSGVRCSNLVRGASLLHLSLSLPRTRRESLVILRKSAIGLLSIRSRLSASVPGPACSSAAAFRLCERTRAPGRSHGTRLGRRERHLDGNSAPALFSLTPALSGKRTKCAAYAGETGRLCRSTGRSRNASTNGANTYFSVTSAEEHFFCASCARRSWCPDDAAGTPASF
mmetsp:Transcript_7052/g.18903  ORF Transcript_7052/g.18903 Transcript_7052/m.18903 type:complete len:201 (-) Transcript_7052:1153-1755(-)